MKEDAEPEAAVEPAGIERIAEQVHQAVLRTLRAEPGATAEVCAALRLLGKATGEAKFRHAAAIVGGISLGRTAIDDHAALRKIVGFEPARRRAAVGIVARQIAGAGATDARVEAVARRLRRKLQKMKRSK
jgi:hypothetical protein